MPNAQVINLAGSNFLKRARQQVASVTGWQIALPSRVSISPTLRCMMRCQQCDIWKLKLDDEELGTDQWKQVLSSLRQWLGCFHLNITGGEPFLRRDITEFLGFCSDIGIIVGVVTSGYVVTGKIAREVLARNVFNINLSLDGATAETHDQIRGRVGAYKRALEAIEHLTTARNETRSTTRLILKVTIMQQNITEIQALLKLAEDKRLSGVLFQPLDDNLWSDAPDPRWFEKSSLWIRDYGLASSAVDKLIAAKKSGAPVLNTYKHLRAMKAYFKCPTDVSPNQTRPCSVGMQNLDIGYNGDVRFCDYMPPIGNIKESTPKEIWSSGKAAHVRQLTRHCTRPCLATCHLERTLQEQADMAFSLFLPKQ